MVNQETIAEYIKDSEFFEILFNHMLSEDDVGRRDKLHTIEVFDVNSRKLKKVLVDDSCYIATVDRVLRKNGIEPHYEWNERWGNPFMKYFDVNFRPRDGGIVMFLNDREPNGGKTPLTRVYPKPGDRITLAYTVQTNWGKYS